MNASHDLPLRDRRLLDRWWFWLLAGFGPLVVVIGAVIVTDRTEGPGYIDGLAHLDEVPCDDGSACAPSIRLDGELIAASCTEVHAALVTDDLIAQGPGGRGYRITAFDAAVAFAVTDSLICSEFQRDRRPLLVGECVASGNAVVDAVDDC